MSGDKPVSSGKERRTRFAELLYRASRARGLRGLSEEELLEFGRLYRRTASELSHARSYGLDEAELERLNSLVRRAYGLLYVSKSAGWAGVARFFRAELPQTLRRHWRLLFISAALFFGPALFAASITLGRPDLLDLVNPRMADLIREIGQRHKAGQDWLPADFRPIASCLIMFNNIRVSLLAFATGILLGLGTIFILIVNGFLLGVIGAGVSQTPAALHFWAFVAPHGVIELPAIIISGAAGLLLGLAVVDPGDHTRVDALRLAGRQAAVIMLGVAVFLVVAGLVEGLFSPALLPPPLKFLVAFLLAAAFSGYLLLAGRES